MNTGAPWPTLSLDEAEARVRGIQAKLHRWATQDRTRRFDDLFNLVGDPGCCWLGGYRRIAKRRGKQKAMVATGNSILVIVYHLLSDPEARFTDLAPSTTTRASTSSAGRTTSPPSSKLSPASGS